MKNTNAYGSGTQRPAVQGACGLRSPVLAGILKVIFAAVIALMTPASPVPGMGYSFRGDNRVAPDITDRELADELVGKVFSAYRDFTIPSFMEVLSEHYFPDRIQTVNMIGDVFYGSVLLEINYFLNEVTRKNNTLAVNFDWKKKVHVKDTGRQVKSEGNTLFVYEYHNGSWKLKSISGDNPLI